MTPPARRQGKYFTSLGVAAARAADDKKGEDIRLLNIRSLSTIADCLLLVSVGSPNHMKAVEEHIRATLKSGGTLAQHRDGRQSDLWRVLDYGGLLVHLMHPRAREHYAIEKLYHEAKIIPWNGEAAPPGKTSGRGVKHG